MPREDYIATIGLEVHCQINAESKMFCGCRAGYGHEPNTNVCPVCLGLPGALPVMNKHAIEQTILAGMLLNCTTPDISKWDRKSYFYPDMPKNFQLTQFDLPLCMNGEVPLYDLAYHLEVQKNIPNPGKKVKMNRIHLEEDVAKSTHQAKSSIIDFNRAGTPLMEIVTEPDIDNAEEAYAFLKSLQQIMRYGGISDADMEKGQMRCDVNISVRKKGTDELGTKLEIKNLNSISNVRASIYYEIERQCEEYDQGIEQKQATLRWDPNLGQTFVMRLKENSDDYRYFPEPDLLPVKTEELVEKMRSQIPELPHDKRDRFESNFGVSSYDAGVLTSEIALANYFEKAAANKAIGKKVANWIINTLLAKLNETGFSLSDSPILPESLASLVELIEAGTISNNQAKDVFAAMWDNPQESPAAIAKSMGFEPTDSSELDGIIDQIVNDNPDKVAEIQGGNPKLVNWLTGQVMKASKGKANPKIVTDMLTKKLGL
ncbi:Asp-tRNA(Asn)/Glu-tRNA(Gln) amidotransferase subunit GatB [Akkermansiaceae bacterium]|nr:Asp-tRNA(Asn)/Glu-tRNA(Gln) amidotransferase subunit GatB [Akkermansiaceae bacterium]